MTRRSRFKIPMLGLVGPTEHITDISISPNTWDKSIHGSGASDAASIAPLPCPTVMAGTTCFSSFALKKCSCLHVPTKPAKMELGNSATLLGNSSFLFFSAKMEILIGVYRCSSKALHCFKNILKTCLQTTSFSTRAPLV